jgi:hypothetical protein
MQAITFCYAVLAVSIIYCVWLGYLRAELRRRRLNCVQHYRRAFLLCRMATRVPRLGSSTPDAAKKRPSESNPQRDTARWRKDPDHTGAKPSGTPKRNSGSGWFLAERR